jgi:hypothetical protein
MFEFARAEDEMTSGQLRGLGLALLALIAILLGVFRSVSLAAYALVPNVLPIIATYGMMGLIGVPLDAGTVIVGSLALGIAVDDTMHVLAAHQQALANGAKGNEAIRVALSETLPAVSYTTIVIAAGFGVLSLSGFTFIRNLGSIIAGIMIICWLADVYLLPALLARTPEESALPGSRQAPRN